MSTTQTPHLGLIKPTPGTGEYADVSVINGNMDKLDAAIGEVDVTTDGSLQSQIDGIQESVSFKVESPADLSESDRVKHLYGNSTYGLVFVTKNNAVRYVTKSSINNA